MNKRFTSTVYVLLPETVLYCLTLHVFVLNGIFNLIHVYNSSTFQNLGVSGCVFLKIYLESGYKQYSP